MRYSAILLALVAIAGCSDRSERHAADPRVADASRPLVFLTNPEEPPCSYVDASGELYGDDRLLKTLSGSACRRQDLLDAVIADVRRHAAGAEQADDCTQLVIRYCGEPPAGGGLKG